MQIHEYQAKQIMAEFGVPVPRGRVARSPQEARQVAEELGGPVVVKAQIHAGGRGKGGGIELASTPQEAEQAARQGLRPGLHDPPSRSCVPASLRAGPRPGPCPGAGP